MEEGNNRTLILYNCSKIDTGTIKAQIAGGANTCYLLIVKTHPDKPTYAERISDQSKDQNQEKTENTENNHRSRSVNRSSKREFSRSNSRRRKAHKKPESKHPLYKYKYDFLYEARDTSSFFKYMNNPKLYRRQTL